MFDKRSIFILLYVTSLISCSSSEKEVIVLTHGMSMDPDEPRKSVVLRRDEVISCVEILDSERWSTPRYRYFHSDLDLGVFLYFKKSIRAKIQEKIHGDSIRIEDADYFELMFKLDNDSDTLIFDVLELSTDQKEILDSLMSISVLAIDSIPSFEIQSRLLNEKLPWPPAVSNAATGECGIQPRITGLQFQNSL